MLEEMLVLQAGVEPNSTTFLIASFVGMMVVSAIVIYFAFFVGAGRSDLPTPEEQRDEMERTPDADNS